MIVILIVTLNDVIIITTQDQEFLDPEKTIHMGFPKKYNGKLKCEMDTPWEFLASQAHFLTNTLALNESSVYIFRIFQIIVIKNMNREQHY